MQRDWKLPREDKIVSDWKGLPGNKDTANSSKDWILCNVRAYIYLFTFTVCHFDKPLFYNSGNFVQPSACVIRIIHWMRFVVSKTAFVWYYHNNSYIIIIICGIIKCGCPYRQDTWRSVWFVGGCETWHTTRGIRLLSRGHNTMYIQILLIFLHQSAGSRTVKASAQWLINHPIIIVLSPSYNTGSIAQNTSFHLKDINLHQTTYIRYRRDTQRRNKHSLL